LVEAVIKRDNREEAFIVEKLVVSCVKAGADIETARRIATELQNEIAEEKIRTEKLRELVLERLKSINPQWYENWLLYDRAVKRRY